jgi:outer membrane receptor protein involved in Fe transport
LLIDKVYFYRGGSGLLFGPQPGGVLNFELKSAPEFQQALQIQTALEYFFNDNDYYPSSFEFKNVNVMGSYFKKFPIVFIASNNCRENILYNRVKLAQYELNFCLDNEL